VDETYQHLKQIFPFLAGINDAKLYTIYLFYGKLTFQMHEIHDQQQTGRPKKALRATPYRPLTGRPTCFSDYTHGYVRVYVIFN